jgi:CheY-like chemotaxis protein
MFSEAPVLIAEDNLYIALDLSNAIEDMDGKVVGPASTVAEALQLLEQHHVAAAILDCQLGEHDTASLARVLAQRGVPFVIHTATPVSATLATLHPDVPVLLKPLQPRAVLTCLLDEMRKLHLPHRAEPPPRQT